jgi:hypothetical protein
MGTLLRDIIFSVGNYKKMHLSPTKKHGIHRVKEAWGGVVVKALRY